MSPELVQSPPMYAFFESFLGKMESPQTSDTRGPGGRGVYTEEVERTGRTLLVVSFSCTHWSRGCMVRLSVSLITDLSPTIRRCDSEKVSKPFVDFIDDPRSIYTYFNIDTVPILPFLHK